MARRFLLPLLLACGTFAFAAGEPLAQRPGNTQKKPPAGKKTGDKKPDRAKPKPTTAKPSDPEPEDSLDTTKPTNPLDLAHGLREKGMPDLAIEYLGTLDPKSLPEDIRTVLPLEIARARLDAVPLEPERGNRAAFLARAKTEFDRFLHDHPKHDRAPEAALSLARISAVQARTLLARAMSAENNDRMKEELATARTAFDEADRRFAKAIGQIAAQLKAGKVEGVRKYELTRDLRTAELEHGIVLFRKADTYATEVKERGKTLLAAKARFKSMAEQYLTRPIGWAARAWAAECDYSVQNNTEAEAQTVLIRNSVSSNFAAREGLRMSRFFEVFHKYQAARTPAEIRSARELGEKWLGEYKSAVRPTPEQFSVRYYVAFLKVEEAKAIGVKADPKTKQMVVSQTALRLLREAEKELRTLSDADNDYAERAARQRTRAIHLIIGDAAKPPEAYPTFDECQMAALVQIDKSLHEPTAGAKAAKLAAASALLERAVRLAGPATAPRDKLDAQVQLAFVYLAGDHYAQAAALGEQVARTTKSSGPAARAGALAVQAYLQLPADGDAANASREKAYSLATLLEERFPDDPSTDSIRMLHGDSLLKQQHPDRAYSVLSRVSAGYPDQARARLLQGVAAFWLLGDRSPVPEKDRPKIYAKVVADMAAVPAPSPQASSDDARTYLRLRQQLASLHLLANRADAVPPVTNEMIRTAEEFTYLSLPFKRVHEFEAERLADMAVVARAKPLYDARKFTAMAKVLDPALIELAKSLSSHGPAVKQAADLAAKTGADGKPLYEAGELGELASAADKLDHYRRDALVVLALQGRIRGGQADQAAELVGLLKRLGGNLEANAQTLGNLTRVVREQAIELRKKGHAAEADTLVAGVGTLIDKIAAEKGQSPAMQVFLGIALKDLGRYDRAVELLKRAPSPTEADLNAAFASLSEEKKSTVRLYRNARLELVRAYRLGGLFDQAEQTLAAAAGTDAKPGWARHVLEFRRESNLLLEARAAAESDAKKKGEYWGRAKQGWDRLANEYAAALQAMRRRPLPADDPAKANEEKKKRDQVKSLYFDLFADALQCVVHGNMDLLKDKPDQLGVRLKKVAEQMVVVETRNADLSPEVKAKFAEMLVETPYLKGLYEKAGGKLFVQAPDAGGQ